MVQKTAARVRAVRSGCAELPAASRRLGSELAGTGGRPGAAPLSGPPPPRRAGTALTQGAGFRGPAGRARSAALSPGQRAAGGRGLVRPRQVRVRRGRAGLLRGGVRELRPLAVGFKAWAGRRLR